MWWVGEIQENLIGDRGTPFLSIIDLYNPRPDIENIQFIMCRYVKTPHSISGILELLLASLAEL